MLVKELGMDEKKGRYEVCDMEICGRGCTTSSFSPFFKKRRNFVDFWDA